MAHTYGSCLYHFVFSTRNRKKTIQPEWMARLWEYIGGIARGKGMKALCVGGTENHLHVLMMIPPDTAPAKGVQLIKANSSIWIKKTFPLRTRFSWQVGYGVISIGFSQIEKTRNYIMPRRCIIESGPMRMNFGPSCGCT
jgi:REP element-mobilizing transposase RayT